MAGEGKPRAIRFIAQYDLGASKNVPGLQRHKTEVNRAIAIVRGNTGHAPERLGDGGEFGVRSKQLGIE